VEAEDSASVEESFTSGFIDQVIADCKVVFGLDVAGGFVWDDGYLRIGCEEQDIYAALSRILGDGGGV